MNGEASLSLMSRNASGSLANFPAETLRDLALENIPPRALAVVSAWRSAMFSLLCRAHGITLWNQGQLKQTRNTYGWVMTALMLVVYYGYIALIAFDKAFLATPLGAGVTTIGIPIGVGVILFTIIITGIYVRRANNEFDAMKEALIEECK